ncbi:MAG: PASTA domain-containing protein, partial [Oscillospiraceae bacterium]|nr:PASTA domain-containing protein [Oscillospiraceae bacterium]
RTLPDLIGKDIDYARDTLTEKYIHYEVQTEVGTYGDPEKVVAMSMEAETVIDITQVHKVTIYVYDVEPVSSEETSSEDTTWVDDLV